MDLKKLKKAELEELCNQLQKELKESRSFVSNLKKQKDTSNKEFLATGVVKINGVYCATKVKYDIEDVESIIECPQGPHMSDYEARKILARDIIHRHFEYEGDL